MMGAMTAMEGGHAGHGMMEMPPAARHARTEYGANNDMRVDYPRTNLDDPGAGLRGRPWRVLTYADLRSPDGDPDPRDPGREIELHLTGRPLCIVGTQIHGSGLMSSGMRPLASRSRRSDQT